MFLHYDYNVDWTEPLQTRGKGPVIPNGLAREKLFSVCCMLYGVCVFGALELYVAAACCLVAWLLGC